MGTKVKYHLFAGEAYHENGGMHDHRACGTVEECKTYFAEYADNKNGANYKFRPWGHIVRDTDMRIVLETYNCSGKDEYKYAWREWGIEDARQKVIDAFDDKTKAFSHVTPHRYTNFIDGLAFLSPLARAAAEVGDDEVCKTIFAWTTQLMNVGEDARNFAPEKVNESWLPSEIYTGIYYKPKPQSFAGLAAYAWATEYYVHPNLVDLATFMIFVAPVYGHLVHWVTPLRQHLNSMMFAHMLLGKKPPNSLHFAAKDNMIYSYIYGEVCDTPYLNTSFWAAKDVWKKEEKEQQYVPVCELTGRYLQMKLKGECYAD